MISAILLAAGESKRMKGENKLIKEINGLPLIKHAVKNILDSAIDELIIVLGHEKSIIENLIKPNKKIKFIFNKNYKNGMSSSITAGLNHMSKKADAFFICLGDMPRIDKKIYNYLSSFIKNKDIIVPTYNSVQANPVLFSKSMKSNIMKISGDIGAKKILKLNEDKMLKVEINNISIIRDFNTKSDFNSDF